MAYINGLDETGGGLVESVGDGLSLSATGFLVAEATQAELDAKQSIISSSNRLNANLIGNGSVSNTEMQYLSGVNTPIQTALNSKQSTINSNNRVNATNIASGIVTNSELNQLHDINTTSINNGGSGTVQQQINSKQATIADDDLTIAKTNNLQTKLDEKLEKPADISSGTRLLKYNQGGIPVVQQVVNISDVLTAGSNISFSGKTINARKDSCFYE
jgi:hypothetical protein